MVKKLNSDPIQLQNSQTHKDPFEHGHTDVFTQFLPSLGKIKSATLWHTGDKSSRLVCRKFNRLQMKHQIQQLIFLFNVGLMQMNMIK